MLNKRTGQFILITDSAGNEFSGKRATSKERPRQASSKMETLPQPISSSDATAPNNRYKVGPSGRAYTSTMLRSLTLNLSGYCVGDCFANSRTIGSSSAAAASGLTPGRILIEAA